MAENLMTPSSLFDIYKSLFNHHQDACYALDLHGNFLMLNHAAIELTGYSQLEAQQMSIFSLIMSENIDNIVKWFKSVLNGNRKITAASIKKKNGKKVDLSITAVPIYSDSRIYGIVGTAKVLHRKNEILDMIEKGVPLPEVLEKIINLTEEKINYMALHDELTGLPNRRFFKNRLNNAIANHRNAHGKKLGLMLLDLDRFKLINNTLGHNMGDLLLKEVSLRLQSCIREKDIASRQGGDEFTILLEDVSKEETSFIAYRIIDEMAKPFTIGGNEVFITPSIGISLHPHHGENANELLKKADVAMYHAKNVGKNNFQFYHPIQDNEIHERLEIENELRKALNKDEFTLRYQPIIDLSTYKMSGVEVLIRWNHPIWGVVSPSRFIPIAEETGMIVPIGEWVLQTACRQLKTWEKVGLFPQTISVNISLRQFYQPNFIAMIRQILKESEIDPNRLIIEITESMTMDVEKVSGILHDLKSLGVKISIDDFGMGYSSLSYLKAFPIDHLKIDKSFIQDIEQHKGDKNIAITILLMARNLGLRVIAEGVETKEQLAVLKQYKCHNAQGFLFSHPLSAEELYQSLVNPPWGYAL